MDRNDVEITAQQQLEQETRRIAEEREATYQRLLAYLQEVAEGKRTPNMARVQATIGVLEALRAPAEKKLREAMTMNTRAIAEFLRPKSPVVMPRGLG